MKELKLNVPEGKAQEFAQELMKLVKKYDAEIDKDSVKSLLPVTERIKTFEDACNELGDEHPLVTQYRLSAGAFKGDQQVEDFIAYLQLRIIAAALNEGWEPQFTKDEYRYYPWFYLYTQDEVDKMDEEERSKLLLVGGSAANIAQCGISCSVSDNVFAFSSSYAGIGSRLAFKTSELAEYAGTQFLSIWSAYVFKPVKED